MKKKLSFKIFSLGEFGECKKITYVLFNDIVDVLYRRIGKIAPFKSTLVPFFCGPFGSLICRKFSEQFTHQFSTFAGALEHSCGGFNIDEGMGIRNYHSR